MMKALMMLTGLVALSLFVVAVYLSSGDGAFKRAVTVSGVYSICKPEGYPAVCFGDASSKEGGVSCVPYQGDCKP